MSSPHRPARGHFSQCYGALEAEFQAAAADAFEADSRLGSGKTFPKDEKAGLQVVVAGRKAELLVKPNLTVRERGATVGFELAEKLPQNAARYPFDHILTIHEDAVVGLVVDDRYLVALR